MTLTILVSFSLLALVVTSRPIVPQARSEASIQSSTDVQHTVQAIFQYRTGRPPACLDCAEEEDIRIHLTSSEEQDGYLAQLDGLDAVRAILPLGLDGALTDDEAKLYSLLRESKTGGHLDDLEGGERPMQDDELISQTGNDPPSPSPEPSTSIDPATNERAPTTFPSPPLLVLALSCGAALISLLCIIAVLYAAQISSKGVFTSDLAWEMMPKLEKQSLGGADADDEDGSGPSKERDVLLVKDLAPSIELEAFEMSAEKVDERGLVQAAPSPELTPEDDERDEDTNEDYQDAPDSGLLFADTGVSSTIKRSESPRIVIEEHPDPELLPLFPTLMTPTPFATPDHTPHSTRLLSPLRRPLQMRETPTASPISKPAWSLRAADSPSFALSRSSTPLPFSRSSSPKLPGALIFDSSDDEGEYGASSETDIGTVGHADRRHAYRAPIPELDIAFALQLRPGLGLGADPAWLVRFLMAMFGWMTVLLGGGGVRREQRVAH
ncbi:hypothetical protein BKA93DRAFT_825567 [Sparassis latifolia]